MAEMNVTMLLTLVDRASPGVKAFMDLLNGLDGVVKNVNAGIVSLQAAMRANAESTRAAATATAAAANQTNRYAAAAENARQAASKLPAATESAASSILAMGSVAAAATANIQLMATQLGGLVAATRGLRALANTPVLPGLGNANQQATTLTSTMKGLVALWAAMKVEKGVVASVEQAADIQAARAQVEGLNLGAARTAEIMDKAFSDSKALKFVSVLDAIHIRMAAMGGLAQTTDDRVIDATLSQATKLANNLRIQGDKTSLQDLVRNAYGFVEARGQTSDPDAANRSFDLLQRASTVTGGKITMRDMEMMIRQFGQGATQLSDDGIYKLISVMDQMKISGGEGSSGGGSSRVGTVYKMLEAYGMGKTMSRQGTVMMTDAGIMDDKGQMENSKLLASDPVAWVESLLPKILAMTAKYSKTFYPDGNVNDPRATAVAIQKFLTMTGVSVTTAQAEALSLQPDSAARITRQGAQAKNALGVDGQAAANAQTYKQSVQDFDAALNRLSGTIGDKLIPMIQPLVEGMTKFFNLITDFTKSDPLTAMANLSVGAFGTITVGLIGFSKLFSTMLPAAVATGLRGVTGAFTRLLGWAGALLLAWDIGTALGTLLHDWLVTIEHGGVDILTWAVSWGDRFVTTIENAWARSKNFFGLMTDGAMKAQIAANDAGLKQRLDANLQPNLRSGNGEFWNINKPVEGSGSVFDTDTTFPFMGPAPARAAAARTAGGQVLDTKKKKKAGHGYNAEADAANTEYKEENDDLRTELKIADALYKEGTLSVEQYYDTRQALLENAIERKKDTLMVEFGAYYNKNDKAGMNRVAAKYEAADNELASGSAENEANKKVALEKLDQDAIALKRSLMTAEGERHAAEMMHMQQIMDVKNKELVLNGKITQAEADAAHARSQAAIDYERQASQLAIVKERYSEKIAQIDIAEKNGFISKTEADEQKLAVMKQEAAELDILIAKLRELAVAKGDDATVSKLDKMKSDNGKVLGAMDPTQVAILGDIRNGFAQTFSSILNGSEKAGKAVEQFTQNLKKSFMDIISKKLGDALFSSLFGDGGKSGSSVGGLFGMVGSMFGFGGGGSSPEVDSGSVNMFAGDMPSFAIGIDRVPRDMVAQVHKDERILTARENAAYTQGLRGGGSAGGGQVHVSFDDDMRNTRVVDVLDAHIRREMYSR